MHEMLPRHDCEPEWEGASVSKDIKAGTWWLDEDDSIVFVALDERTLPLDMTEVGSPFMCYYMDGEGEISQVFHAEDQLVRELPGCTGFDYKEPPAIPTPGDHPTQWVPIMGVDGQVYHCLGYVVPNR